MAKSDNPAWCRGALAPVIGGVAAATLTVVTGCGSTSGSANASVSSSSSTSAAAAAATATPQVTPGVSIGGHGYNGPLSTPDIGCDSPLANNLPVFETGGEKPPPNYGLGTGPVYWSGQDVWHTAGEEAVILVDPIVTVPVTVMFIGPGGMGSATFGGTSEITLPPVSDGWAYAYARFVPSIAGCWTMRATFSGRDIRVHFTVVSGAPPPG